MNKAPKNILLTFDYELFLGPVSGTAKNCLLLPTAELLKVLHRQNSKAIFFIDILYLMRLKEVSIQFPYAKAGEEAVRKQIAEIAAQGHYVYLHIHPHWLDAVYMPEKNQWDLSNTSRFALSNLPTKEGFALLEKGYQLLHEIIAQVPNAHAIEGFRAGGLFIQPFHLFYDFLKKYKLPYEFSVYPSFSSRSKICEVDFTQVPSKRIYNFENNCCEEQAKGYFTQYTISEINMAGVNRLVNSAQFRWNKKIFKDQAWGDGKGALHIMSNNNKKIGLAGIVKETAAVELMNLWKNKIYMTHLREENLLHFLSHPKLISPLNLIALEKFLIKAGKKYQLVTDFKHFHLI
jgi:hypothetical protein